MTCTQQSKRARTTPKDGPNRSLSEELSQVTDLVERRRMQNRISQRNYRNKIRVRLENLEALVEAQNQAKLASDAGSVAGSSSSAASARFKGGSAEHVPAPTPADSLSTAPSVGAPTPPEFGPSSSTCLQESFDFGASAGSDLSFLSPACPHTHPFGGPLSSAPGTPQPHFAAGFDSPPSLLGDLEDAESRKSSIEDLFTAPTGSVPLELDQKAAIAAGTLPGFALGRMGPGTPKGTGHCNHLQIHAPCCGQLVAAYPVAMGVPVLPLGLPAMQQHQGQDGQAGPSMQPMLAPMPQYLQYAPLGQYQLPQGLDTSASKGLGAATTKDS